MAHRVVHYIHSERGLAFLLIGLAAALSTLLTNDVALFVVVPLTLSLHELTPLPLKRLVIFIALSVNAGSILTPLGNPQNLFLWQTSGASFGGFVAALAPLCAALMAMLYVLAAFSFRGKALDLSKDAGAHDVDRRLLGVAAVLFVAFVLLADTHHAGIGLAGIMAGFLLWRREIVLKIDWLLLLIFVFMFIVLRSVAALPWVHQCVGQLGLATTLRAFAAGADSVARHQQRSSSHHARRVHQGLACAGIRRQRRRLRFCDRLAGESDCSASVETARYVAAVSSLCHTLLARCRSSRWLASVAYLIRTP